MFVFIDTAVKGCNVALADEGRIIAIHQEPIERGHAEIIIPIFEKLLSDNGRKPSDVQHVFVTVGPGSFTGLRVGLTTARFIGFTLNIPVKGISSFQSFSCGVSGGKDRLVLVETKRSDYYVQLLNSAHKALSEPQCIPTEGISNFVNAHPNAIVTGDAVSRFVDEHGAIENAHQQDMIDLSAVAQTLCKADLETRAPEAFYIRDADVSQPKKKTV
ncbi:MAG: tRNA (adenosine(37)-N6)-threonylcarbamoyltransferase complex dimerization subunit type 1 TsaB [Alphaproteobacteria bacterium]|nr:MAG: tRNA (adenosine(37)-N6)-threonylcarbamoyltransferase complex dimerization subunit type 1 TsaB [Alphaproteobacteria bacterium]